MPHKLNANAMKRGMVFSAFFEDMMDSTPEVLLPFALDYMGVSKPPEFWIRALKKQPDGLPVPQRIYFSDEPMRQDQPEWHIRPADQDEYTDLYHALQEGDHDKYLLKRLLALQTNNPHSPLPLNLLSIFYSLRKKSKKVQAVLEQTRAEFPDYLFGWVNLGLHAMQTDQPEQAVALLKGKYELYEHLPMRLYHISEIGSFYTLACQVHAYQGRLLRAAYACSQVMQSLDTVFEQHDQIMLCVQALTTYFSSDELILLNTVTQRKLRKLR